MRKLILMAILIACLSSVKAQISFTVPVGISSNKVPTIGSNLQWKINHFFISGGFDSEMSSKVKYGDFFWGKIGSSFTLDELNCLELGAGVGNYVKSSSDKAMNEGLGLLSVAYVHQMKYRPEGSIVLQAMGTQRFAFISVGLRFTFLGKQRYGCAGANVR
jgi:hypothetical protein